MPFRPNVREHALVAAARHCCVCHRYKGVKVEVHHIVPESRGGTNDLDNTIALCFDCHTDAGHYNPGHPRGTKFSPEELRLARDMWHETVRRGSIEPPADPDALYCRYLICKSFEVFEEITTANLSKLPFERPFVVMNDVHRFHRRLTERNPTPRHRGTETDDFESWEDYAQAHPGVRIVERSDYYLYPYFQAMRTPPIEEVRQKIALHDRVTQLLVEGGVPAREISLALAYVEMCGGTHRIREIYRTRPLWPLYLAVTNLRPGPVALQAMVCELERPEGLGYRHLSQKIATSVAEEPFPSAALPTGATALVPLATLLCPIDDVDLETMSEDSQLLQSERSQTVTHADLSIAYKDVAVIGPASWPHLIRLIDAGSPRQQSLHEFNPSNLYMIDRHWLVGSCPHLFAYEPGRTSPRYMAELFARQPGVSQVHRFQVPLGIKAFAITELEPEQTVIEQISVNDRVEVAGVVLGQGQAVRLEVNAGDRIVIVGRYETNLTAPQQPWIRNGLIRQYITRSDTSNPG